MATNPAVDANLASADDLLVRLLEHVEGNKSADLQLVALTAQALATVALVRVVTDLAQALIDRQA
jgi:hypothetical protein